MKFVTLEPVIGNNYGVLSYYCRSLSEAMARKGAQAAVLDGRDPDFMRSLLSYAIDPEAVIYAGHFFHDLRINAHLHYGGENLFDLCGARVMGRLGDHPFADFMVERILHSPNTATLWADSPSMIEEANFFFFEKSLDLAVTREFCCLSEDEIPDNKPHHDRPIDVLVPLSLSNRSLRSFLDKLGERGIDESYGRFCELLHGLMLDHYGVHPPLHDFLRALEHYNISDWRSLNADTRQFLRNCLWEVDEIVRLNKRHELLEGLADFAPHLRVVVTAEAGLYGRPVPSNVDFIGPQSFETILSLMSQSRIIAHAPASFPETLHERVMVASRLGCATVSLFGQRLQEELGDGTGIRFTSKECGLAETCAQIDKRASQRLADHAGAVIENGFLAGHHAEQIIARIGG